MVNLIRQVIPRRIAPLVMILLTAIPALVAYEGVAANLPVLPDFDAPGWFTPVGVGCIILIFILALSMGEKKNQKKKPQ